LLKCDIHARLHYTAHADAHSVWVSWPEARTDDA